MLELVRIDVIKHELEAYKKDVAEVVEYTRALEIKSPKEAERAMDYIARSKDLTDKITRKKLELTEEARDFTSKVNNIAKEFLEPLFLVKDMILQKIDHWKLEEKAQAEDREQMAQVFDMEITPSFNCFSSLKGTSSRMEERNSFSFSIVDDGLIPREYLMLDEKKVKALVKAGVRNIPGLKIEQTTKTIVKRMTA